MRADAWLRETGFMPDEAALRRVEDGLIAAMEAGLDGRGGLPMLPAYVSAPEVKRARRAIVLDAGGTHLRAALMQVTPDGRAQVILQRVIPTPGTQGRISAEAFFDEIAALIAPMCGDSGCIGFCFSFACEILPDRDARVLYLDKELQVDGLAGCLVAEGLRGALAARGLRSDHRITVLNDTVAAQLGASGEVGMILGTGFNCCYGEANGRIRKDAALCERPGRTIVNTECGAFDALPLTAADFAVHAATADGASNALEKTLSGAYQGLLLASLMRGAAEAGVLRIGHIPEIGAKDITALLLDPGASGLLRDCSPDWAAVTDLARGVIDRAAAFTAATLHAILRKGDLGLHAPAGIAAEGSTFWRNPFLREEIIRRLQTTGRDFRIVSTPEANLAGAAMAALSDEGGTPCLP